MNLNTRRAIPGEADELSEIAYSAIAHWGYPRCWMEIWKPQFDFLPEYFERHESWVVELEDRPIGFYTLQEKNGNAWLENLWVLPEFIGRGIGRQLFIHALSRSRTKGHLSLQLEADPNAVGFYEKMGMFKIGERKYEVEGKLRILPIMEMKL